MQVDPHSFTNSFFQVDPNNPSIITLPDGTTAQVQGVATVGPNDTIRVPPLMIVTTNPLLCSVRTFVADERVVGRHHDADQHLRRR